MQFDRLAMSLPRNKSALIVVFDDYLNGVKDVCELQKSTVHLQIKPTNEIHLSTDIIPPEFTASCFLYSMLVIPLNFTSAEVE